MSLTLAARMTEAGQSGEKEAHGLSLPCGSETDGVTLKSQPGAASLKSKRKQSDSQRGPF